MKFKTKYLRDLVMFAAGYFFGAKVVKELKKLVGRR